MFITVRKRFSCYAISLIIIFFVFSIFIASKKYSKRIENPIDYSIIFGKNYTAALEYLVKERWMNDTILKYGLSPRFTLSIVFPELIRYTSWKDELESQSLKVLYVQYGFAYANFSIGRFQMKPSFVQQLEEQCLLSSDSFIYHLAKSHNFQFSNTPKSRLERVNRLDDKYWQTRYLCLFSLVLNKHFQNKKWNSNSEKLKYYATVYNSGLNCDSISITKKMQQKFYYTSILKPDVCYNYADVALSYFEYK